MKKICLAAAALAAAFAFYSGFRFIGESAPTYDEPVHLASGYYYLTTGDLRRGPIIRSHPPLAEMIAALPLLGRGLADKSDSPYFNPAGHFCWGDAFLYSNSLPAEEMLNISRKFSFTLWTLLGALFLFLLGRKADSEETGLLAVLVFFLTPAFLANNGLVMTDAAPAVFFLAAAYFGLGLALELAGPARPVRTAGWLAGAAAASAGAMASKFSMLFVPAFICVCLCAGAWRRGGGAALRRAAAVCAALLGLTLFLVAAIYGFSHAGEYAALLREAPLGINGARITFVNGRYYPGGVWWYFPLSFLLHNPPALIILAAAGCAAALRRPTPGRLWIFAPAAVYLALAMTAKMQIAVRHLLPAMPFIILAAASGLRTLAENRAGKAAAAALAAWLAASAYSASPYFISYSNALAGGPDRDWRRFAEASAGQDLKPLARYLAGIGNPPVYLAYFGTARPAALGIAGLPLIGNADLPCQAAGSAAIPQRPLVAVSAAHLLGIHLADKSAFSWLLRRRPLHTAGRTLFLYDLTGDRDGLLRLAALAAKAGQPRAAERLAAQAQAAPPAAPGRKPALTAAAYSAGGALLARSYDDGRLEISGARSAAARLAAGAAALAFSPDSKLLAAGLYGGSLPLLRSDDLAPSGTVEVGGRAAPAAAFSADGKYLAAAAGGRLRIWRLPGLKLVRDIDTGGETPAQLWFSGDSGRLLTADLRGELRDWDLVTGKARTFYSDRPGEALATAAVSPDFRYLAYGGAAGGIKVLDLAKREVLCARGGPGAPVAALAFSPGADLLSAVTSGGALDLLRLPGCSRAGSASAGGGDGTYAAAFSADGTTALAAGPAGTAALAAD